MTAERTMFLALSIPDPHSNDPDVIADDIARSLQHDGFGDVMVSGIPSPQWLTPETLANLRASAEGVYSEGRCPLAVDLVEFVDDQPVRNRRIVAHFATCKPCRLALVRIVQTSTGYPDLFGS